MFIIHILLLFEQGATEIIFYLLPSSVPVATPPGIVPRCTFRLAFTYSKDTKGLLRLSDYLEYETNLKYENNIKLNMETT